MLHWPVHNDDHHPAKLELGFTMIELLVVILLVGVMAAIAAPGMLGFLERSKVISAHSNIQGLLQEAQRSAIRESNSCKVLIPLTETVSGEDNMTISSSCVVSGPRILEDIQIRHNLVDVSTNYDVVNDDAADNLLFDFRGSTDQFLGTPSTNIENLVIVISHEDSNSFQKCIVVSDGLGLIRIGNYPANDLTTIDERCIPTN